MRKIIGLNFNKNNPKIIVLVNRSINNPNRIYIYSKDGKTLFSNEINSEYLNGNLYTKYINEV